LIKNIIKTGKINGNQMKTLDLMGDFPYNEEKISYIQVVFL